jgi:hypothetical protein
VLASRMWRNDGVAVKATMFCLQVRLKPICAARLPTGAVDRALRPTPEINEGPEDWDSSCPSARRRKPQAGDAHRESYHKDQSYGVRRLAT